jgi:acetylglutamate kinase
MNGLITGLRTAVPYLRMFKGTTFVVKVGGEVLADEHALGSFADQVSLLHQLSIAVVVVHGGGRQASELSERLGLRVETVNGRRVTDAATLEVAKMVFNGKLNTDLLAALQRAHVPSVGLSGVDGGVVRAHRRPPVEVADHETGAICWPADTSRSSAPLPAATTARSTTSTRTPSRPGWRSSSAQSS